ncbi:selenocysteine lyase/cysteine desulfurase [Pelomonas saccharophila]|uniref:Selenocysteine lyase/cysteine desulfurase n=2 Tax=Roseateles saccharophilus TaxID=304 RepID=A0ABU1YLH0_ROSSA|nr:selenocysteine lyase/cysteine desulfurase [Roseateles saccharophilus]
MMQPLLLNHAGASPLSAAALAALQDHLALESRLGPMEAGEAVAPRLQRLREDAARLLNAGTDEIAFHGSGSAAFGAAWAAFVHATPLRAGDRILVGRQEWGGNLATYRRSGAQVEVLPCRADGSVDVEAAAKMIDEKVRLISLTWLPANGGLINDAAGLGRVARAAGVPYLIDAGQALGQLPVDVQALGCDVLKGAGRKHLRGPRGTALLYVRKGFQDRLEPPWVDVSGARFETAEQPVALRLALQVAIAEALEIGIGNIAAHVQTLAVQLRERLAELPHVRLHDLGDGPRSGLVSFSVEGEAAPATRARLAQRGIHVGANGVPYTPLDMQYRGLEGIVRASFSWLNNEADIERLASAL